MGDPDDGAAPKRGLPLKDVDEEDSESSEVLLFLGMDDIRARASYA